MNNWKQFESTGKIEDYLKYVDERKLKEARERFVSSVESDTKNGRANNGNGNGDFINAYK